MKWWGCDVDATNQFASYTPEYGGYIDLGEDTGTEWIGRHLHGATMIKAFNAMFAQYIAPDPRHSDGRQVVFYAADDDGRLHEVQPILDQTRLRPRLRRQAARGRPTAATRWAA
jgi:predicted dinucleotide-binding enzyme